jgi:hypothetical protein
LTVEETRNSSIGETGESPESVGFRSFFRRFSRGFARFNDSYGRVVGSDALQYPLGKTGLPEGDTEKRGKTKTREGNDR